MDNTIPSAQEVRDKLAKLGHAETQALAEQSGVPFTTLWKIRTGETDNPRLKTVRMFFPLLAEDRAATKAEDTKAEAVTPSAVAPRAQWKEAGHA